MSAVCYQVSSGVVNTTYYYPNEITSGWKVLSSAETESSKKKRGKIDILQTGFGQGFLLYIRSARDEGLFSNPSQRNHTIR